MMIVDKPLFISKYRPTQLAHFYFDDSVNKTIELLMRINETNILFIGNANSGKSSLLNVMIREYYGYIPTHNIMFVNNLKEQGIHFFRNEMQTFCKSQSLIPNKKKMIIIDDLDMINQHNQQVFCNYIDKYKNNVCFIMAGTSKQKIIENIQSRTHIIGIYPPQREHLEEFIKNVLKNETIQLSMEAQKYIIDISSGSIRCLLKYLEKIKLYQLSNNTNSTNNDMDLIQCKKLCSTLSNHYFETYITELKSEDPNIKRAIQVLYNISDHGYSVIDILYYFFSFVEGTTMLNEIEKYEIIIVLCEYITIFHNVHEDIVELSLFTRKVYNVCRNNL